MADTPIIPMGDDPESSAAATGFDPNSSARSQAQRLWQRDGGLSSAARSLGDRAEAFLAGAGFDRAPWLAVMFAGGILSWFALKSPWQWTSAIGLSALTALAALALWPPGSAADTERGHFRRALVAGALVFAAGVCVIWVRSEMVGAEPIERPMIERVHGYVLERQDQPSEDRIRLTLAVRDASEGESRKIRVNVPLSEVERVNARFGTGDSAETLSEGARVRMRVRLMPPASPMLPGAYDFARAAWFKGLAATGSLLGEIEDVQPSTHAQPIAHLQRALSAHVRERLDGSPGTIAAAFASGDRGAITEADADAMRDAGLTHLLAISGLHVSAVIAAAYFVVLKLLALIPAVALRVRLPILAAAVGALAGIGYTLLTGAQVPTVRACVAALLVLGALVLGREALSLRMVAMAAIVVLLVWPESLVGPSFQMSFSAVLAIVALHTSPLVREFLKAREEPWARRMGRWVFMLFVTGLVIEIALMPIVLFHFHRAGVYGALANVVAIPLVTFVSMPLIALALALDTIGLGAPVWWCVGVSLDALLGIARFTSAQPGAVKLMPQMGGATIALFALGGLWIALWTSRARWLGLVPVALASVMLVFTPIPDVLIGREGRHVGITLGDGRLLSLRDTRSSYARDNLLELASVTAEPIPLAQWEGAQCSREFCLISLMRGGRKWTLLMARNSDLIEERALAAACELSDIVVAARYLPRSCRPRWLRADKRYLKRHGGLALDLERGTITDVASGQGDHGWWRGSTR
ncbi:MAG: ComEC/Rec2 family competence protein [Erythrobacter sp.]|uniref:ComEC/Rec2 family competence protein n=1 Tax=Erythrobacter sp. TaxID=1042 RepID=UPI002623D75F|nr:ComEC/Rec2 family competence protein [Erythrobacter sp.]MDJ0977795.1 ComEC/Rec2 family competence protein [Erythrobacter sp.]